MLLIKVIFTLIEAYYTALSLCIVQCGYHGRGTIATVEEMNIFAYIIYFFTILSSYFCKKSFFSYMKVVEIPLFKQSLIYLFTQVFFN